MQHTAASCHRAATRAHAVSSSKPQTARSSRPQQQTTTTALQLVRSSHPPPLLPEEPFAHTAADEEDAAAAGSSSTHHQHNHRPSKRAAGFGGSSGSKKSQQQQQQQWVASNVQPLDSCPCKSGLQYQACCQPFLSGHSYPRSAPELARARITAALTGNVSYLVSSTHPDSSLALGGSRDLERRCRRQAAGWRQSKPAVVGMAHCRGDSEGVWLVLAILQATSGPQKGSKEPVLSVMAKPSSSISSTGESPAWLYMGNTTQLPQHNDADALWQLLQQHVPELLRGGGEEGGSSSSSGISSRDVFFVWTTPVLNSPETPEAAAAPLAAAAAAGGGSSGSSSSSSSKRPAGAWYLDLLEPAVESLQAAAGQGARPRGSRQAAVVSMDTLIEARRHAG